MRLLDQRGGGVRVHATHVRDVVALLLQEADHVVVPAEEVARPVPVLVAVGPVEGDLHRRLAVGAVVVVEALPPPVVVGLVGVDRQLVDDVGRRPVLAPHEDDVGHRAVLGRQLRQVDPARPAALRLQRVGHAPLARHHAGRGIGRRDRLALAHQVGHLQHQRGARPAVPAHAVDVQRVGGLGGAHVEVDGGAQVDAGLVGVAHDGGLPDRQRGLGDHVRGGRQAGARRRVGARLVGGLVLELAGALQQLGRLPFGRALLLVLQHDGVGRRAAGRQGALALASFCCWISR